MTCARARLANARASAGRRQDPRPGRWPEAAQREIVAFSDANVQWEAGRAAAACRGCRGSAGRLTFAGRSASKRARGGGTQPGGRCCTGVRYEMALRSLESRIRSRWRAATARSTAHPAGGVPVRLDPIMGPRPVGPVQHGQARVWRAVYASEAHAKRVDGSDDRGASRARKRRFEQSHVADRCCAAGCCRRGRYDLV